MKTTELIRNHIPDVLKMYGLPPVTGSRHYKGDCPICGKRGKFRLDNKDNSGSWVCVCGAGNIWSLLMETQNQSFKEIADTIDEAFNNKPEMDQRRQDPREQTALNKIYSSKQIRDTNVESYLSKRGIAVQPSKAILNYNGNMLSVATDDKRNPIFLHETFLNHDTKAHVKVQKKMTSIVDSEFVNSVAIRMFPVSSTLGIAEGIETALSCKQIYKCNTWSTINSGFMKKFRVPLGVEHLIIFADNDKNLTGLAAAMECANRNLLRKNDLKKVTVRWCADVEDFNDMLMQGSQVYEWKGVKS